MKVILSVFTVGNMPNVGLRGRIVGKMKPFFLYLKLVFTINTSWEQ